MTDAELKLPVRLMNLDALRSEEDRLSHEIHALRDRRDAISNEIAIRLQAQANGLQKADAS